MQSEIGSSTHNSSKNLILNLIAIIEWSVSFYTPYYEQSSTAAAPSLLTILPAALLFLFLVLLVEDLSEADRI